MSPKTDFDSAAVEAALQAAANATTLEQLRRAQAVLLPALLGATIELTAKALGVAHATVSRLRQACAIAASGKPEENVKTPWGGRRNAWMSLEEEAEFLKPWLAQAASGQILVVAPIRAALAQRLGQPVKASVVYRLLARHGWRKVAPDTRHPKSDPVVQEDWKKNCRRHWKPL